MRIAATIVGSTLLITATVLLVIQASADDILYRTQSEFNTIFVTEDSQGVRTLYFQEYGVRQSVVKLGDPDHIVLPYAKAVHVGLALPKNPKRVLIVGLGGGTIPRFLRRHFPELMIDIVELDPAVVRLSRTYFDFRPDDQMRVFVADGRKFIEQSKPIYDVIYLDAYSADSVPFALTTCEFLEATRKALTPDGVVVGNVWSSRSNSLYDSMVRTYQHVFAQVAVNDVQGVSNKIVIATTQPDAIKKDRVVKRVAALAIRGKFPFDLKQIAEDGYHLLNEPVANGEVLRDR